MCVSEVCVCLWAMHRCVCEHVLMRVCLCRMLGRSFGKSGSMCYCVRRCTNMHAHIYKSMKCTDKCNKKYNLLLNQHTKGIVHLKMKILPPFIHPHVVPNLYAFHSSLEHKRRYFKECCNCFPKCIFQNTCNNKYSLLLNQHIDNNLKG